MILWIALTVMIALAAVGLTIPLVRRYEQRPQARTVDILKGQLSEVDAQQAGKLIADPEAEALRTEIKRRILTEDREAPVAARPLPQTAMPWVALGLVAVVTLCATALYALMGHPELTSKPAAQTASAAPSADPQSTDPKSHPMGEVSSMIAGLEAKLQQTPGDANGWQMLGWSYMRTQRPADAAKAYAHAAAIDPNNVEYLSAQGEAMVQSQGKVSDEAAAIFRRALKGDAADPRARYFLAIHRDQGGDHAGAMSDFITLLKSAPPDAPWTAQVRNYVEDLAKDQHIDLANRLPPVAAPAAAPGPSSAQVAAAGQMSDADRQAMIHSMVDKLASALKANPKDSGGWVRLMRARMVLGDTQQAAADYREARKAFTDTPAAQAALQEAAKSLGVPGA
jgi:cytochrome c-type biogenesis protein CcmH